MFIFTNEAVDEVKAAFDPHFDLYREGESHILIKSKSDVGTEVYSVLNDWARTVPSVMKLKSWEKAAREALNALFVDLHDRSSFWPVIFWKAFKEDGVSPAEELGRLIGRLHASRMRPLALDLDPFEASIATQRDRDQEGYDKSLYGVLEGERFLRNDRLDAESPSTGDVFITTNNGNETYWINVHPECDCVKQAGRNDPALYLVKGRVVADAATTIDPALGHIPETQRNHRVCYARWQDRVFPLSQRPKAYEMERVPADACRTIA